MRYMMILLKSSKEVLQNNSKNSKNERKYKNMIVESGLFIGTVILSIAFIGQIVRDNVRA